MILSEFESKLHDEGGIFSRVREGYHLNDEEKDTLTKYARSVNEQVQKGSVSSEDFCACMDTMRFLSVFGDLTSDVLEDFYKELTK